MHYIMYRKSIALGAVFSLFLFACASEMCVTLTAHYNEHMKVHGYHQKAKQNTLHSRIARRLAKGFSLSPSPIFTHSLTFDLDAEMHECTPYTHAHNICVVCIYLNKIVSTQI